jgi:hypothetical protein
MSQASTLPGYSSQGNEPSLSLTGASESTTTVPATPTSASPIQNDTNDVADSQEPSRTDLQEGDCMTYSYDGQSARMWLRRDRAENFMMDESPFVKVHEIRYPDGSDGHATYLLPGSKRGDLIGPCFSLLASEEQAAVLSPYERQHQRQLQKDVPGARQLAWELWVAEGKHEHFDTKSWINTWSPDRSPSMHLYGVGVYNPRVRDDLPQTTTGGAKLALDLQRQKLAATYVDAATCKKDINCGWSEKFLTWVQLIDVPSGGAKVLAQASYGNDPNLEKFLGSMVQEDANGAIEEVH